MGDISYIFKIADKDNSGTFTIEEFRDVMKDVQENMPPELVLLLGICPERGCLIYEYMELGSLILITSRDKSISKLFCKYFCI